MATAEMTPAMVARKVAGTFVGLTVLIGSLTVLFLGMRAVMEIGGSCASGGPYEVANPCPEGVGWMVPVSIWVGVFALGLYIASDSGLPGPKWWPLAWPALFLSLGWNFWEYGLNPPGPFETSIEWGWIVCGMIFVLMGALPLLALVWSPEARRSLLWSDADDEGEPTSVRQVARSAAPTVPKRSSQPRPDPTPKPSGAVVASGAITTVDESAGSDGSGESPDDEVVDELERLARLYRNSELTVAEYQAAKAKVLGEDSP